MRSLLPVSLLGMSLAAHASADTPAWLELEATASCAITRAALARRVSEALIAERAPDSVAEVTIQQEGGGYAVELRGTRGGAAPASKLIHAPDCDEAVDATVVVLALALGAPVSQPAPEARPAEPVAEIRPPSPPS